MTNNKDNKTVYGIPACRLVSCVIAVVIAVLALFVLSRPAGDIYKTDKLIPKIGAVPLYVELTEGMPLDVTYTPDRNLSVSSICLLFANLGSYTDESYISYKICTDEGDTVCESSVTPGEIKGGEWTSFSMQCDLSADSTYHLIFTSTGMQPFFMQVDGYEPGISVGFEVRSGEQLTYGDIFHHSRAILILALIIFILVMLFGKDTVLKSVIAFFDEEDYDNSVTSDKSGTDDKERSHNIRDSIEKIVTIIFLLILFAALSLDIYRTAYVDGIYITADSDGYLREAVNLISGNGFSYEGLAGYKSHFANWPIIYPAMIAGMMFITGANAYLASKYVAMAVIGVLFIILYMRYGKHSWLYALAFTNAGFMAMAYNTWSEIPFVFFMILFGIALGKIWGSKRPSAGYYILLGFSALAAFLTRYFGIYLWAVAGLYWVVILWNTIKGAKQRKIAAALGAAEEESGSDDKADIRLGICKLLFMAISMGISGICALMYLVMNKIRNGYPTGVSRGMWWDDYATLTDDLIKSLVTEIFNVFSLDVPVFISSMDTSLKVWIIVFTVVTLALCIAVLKSTAKDVSVPCTFIIMSVLYYIMFIIVRYRSSMDTFYFRFFAPATVIFVMGLIGLIYEADVLFKLRRMILAAAFLIFILSVTDDITYLSNSSNDRPFYDIAAGAWDNAYSEIPRKSVILWNPIDYRSSWYRPDIYSGELFMSDTWDDIISRYYGSEYICILKSDAEVIVNDGGYDPSLIGRFKEALTKSSADAKYIVIEAN